MPQDVAKAVTIGDAAGETLTVNGATVNFHDTVDSGATFANSLTVNAVATLFEGQVGNGTNGALGTLTTDMTGGSDLTTISTDVVKGAVLDFNDAVNAATDDNWFLQRVRIGVAALRQQLKNETAPRWT